MARREAYYPNPIPLTLEELPRYLDDEFHRIAAAIRYHPVTGSLRLSAPVNDVIFTTAWIKLDLFDQKTSESGGIVAGPNQMIVPFIGIYAVHIGINASVKQTEHLDIMLQVNGVDKFSSPLQMQGIGTNDKPVSLFWESNMTLQQGDIITFNGRNGGVDSISVDFVRTNFSVTLRT